MSDRYTIISVDGHAGAGLRDYRPYLGARWHEEFDAWADAFVNPFADLLAPTAYRNWDSERRLKETESQGVVAEVLFPNTVPPFFAQSNLTALEPTPDDYERFLERCFGVAVGFGVSSDKVASTFVGEAELAFKHAEDALKKAEECYTDTGKTLAR